MYTGYLPFKRKDNCEDYKYLRNISIKSNKMFWQMTDSNQKINEHFKDLMNKMLSEKSEDRPDICSIMQHKWLEGKILTDEELKVEFYKLKKYSQEKIDNVVNVSQQKQIINFDIQQITRGNNQ